MVGRDAETYQEDDRNVQQESSDGVKHERGNTDVLDVAPSDVGNLQEQSGHTVHNRTDRGEVVQGNQRIHLVLGGAEQALHHDETDGLEDDTADLEEEANEDEFDLTEGGNDDTDDNQGHVHEDLEIDGRHTHTPGSQEHGNGGGGLY